MEFQEIIKGKSANVGDVRTWSDNKQHVKTADGWQDVQVPNLPDKTYFDKKNKDSKLGIESTDYLAEYKMTKEQLKFKKKLDQLGFSDFDYAGVKESLDKMFGKGKMNIALEYTSGDDYICELLMTYKVPRKGEKDLDIKRYFRIKDGKVNVSHDLFMLPKEYQDKGYGKKVLQLYYDQYKKAGVEKIDVLANSTVGGYAWAQYGFCCSKQELLNLVKENATSKPWKEASNEIMSIVSDFYSHNPNTTPFPMRLISGLHIKGKHVGKDLLLGTEWHGNINLKDKTQRTIFERYLSDEKKEADETISAIEKLPKTIKSDAVFKNKVKDRNHDTMVAFENVYKELLKTGFNDDEIFALKEIVDVDVFHIHPVDDTIDMETVKDLIKRKDVAYPYAIKLKNEYYLISGHEKVVGDILQNKQKVKLKVHEYQG